MDHPTRSLELMTIHTFELMRLFFEYKSDSLLHYIGQQNALVEAKLGSQLDKDLRDYGGIAIYKKNKGWGNYLRQVMLSKGVTSGYEQSFGMVKDKEFDAMADSKELELRRVAETPQVRHQGSGVKIFSPQDIERYGKFLGYKGMGPEILKAYARLGRR